MKIIDDFKEGEDVKRVIIIVILLITTILIASCSSKETIKLGLTDQIISINELIDNSLETEYEKAVATPLLFTNKNEYERFAKQYFINYGMEDFEYEKYDLLFINVKKINLQGDTLYSVDTIVKLRNSIEITLKTDSKVTMNDSSRDCVIENVIYVMLNKGTISHESNFSVIKK
jgi:hypothetical protein